MRFIFCFILLASLIPSLHARILNEREMRIFIGDNRNEIDHIRTTYKVHKGYAVIEVAKQKILSDFESFGYYKDVILSTLTGAGVGGLSTTKKANPFERRIGYLALYAIGINAEAVTHHLQIPHLDMPTDAQRRHVDICNELIRQSNSIRSDSVRLGLDETPAGSRRFAELIEQTRISLSKQNFQPKTNKVYKVEDFKKEGELDKKYRKLPIKLSFAQTADERLRDTTLCGQPAANIFKSFREVIESKAYKDLKKFLDGGVRRPMTVMDEEKGEYITVGCVVTESDIKGMKAGILNAMYQNRVLQSLFEMKGQYRRLKSTVRAQTLRLMKKIHDDKLDTLFKYDEDLVRIGNELNEILAECKEVSISTDWRGKLFYIVDAT